MNLGSISGGIGYLFYHGVAAGLSISARAATVPLILYNGISIKDLDYKLQEKDSISRGLESLIDTENYTRAYESVMSAYNSAKNNYNQYEDLSRASVKFVIELGDLNLIDYFIKMVEQPQALIANSTATGLLTYFLAPYIIKGVTMRDDDTLSDKIRKKFFSSKNRVNNLRKNGIINTSICTCLSFPFKLLSIPLGIYAGYGIGNGIRNQHISLDSQKWYENVSNVTSYVEKSILNLFEEIDKTKDLAVNTYDTNKDTGGIELALIDFFSNLGDLDVGQYLVEAVNNPVPVLATTTSIIAGGYYMIPFLIKGGLYRGRDTFWERQRKWMFGRKRPSIEEICKPSETGSDCARRIKAEELPRLKSRS